MTYTGQGQEEQAEERQRPKGGSVNGVTLAVCKQCDSVLEPAGRSQLRAEGAGQV